MNLKLEVYLYLDGDEWNPEEITRLTMTVSDLVVKQGYGNVASEDADNTRLKSVLVVKPTKGRDWERSADGKVMLVTFPTDDEEFVKQADLGGIKELR